MAATPLRPWLPSRLLTERLNDSEIELLTIFTMGMGHISRVIGSTLDPADPASRLEVCIVGSHGPRDSELIYLTKYRGQQVGERSVGLHPDIADDIAAMLRDAAAVCGRHRREPPPAQRDRHKSIDGSGVAAALSRGRSRDITKEAK